MLKKSRFLTLATAATLFLASPTAWSYAMTSTDGWTFQQGGNYSASPYSSPDLRVHHSMEIRLRPNMVNTVTFGLGCTAQSESPFFQLEVPSLDIRLFDTFNNTVFVRFYVKGEKHEHSLRGEVIGRNQIIMAPVSKAQERSIGILFNELRHGKQVHIALLQGETMPPRIYKVPLDGFSTYAGDFISSCQQYKSSRAHPDYIADHVTCEPKNYSPKNFSLMPKRNSYTMPQPVVEKPVEEEIIIEKKEVTKPEVIPFTPGGGPVSIGPDGKPIGLDQKSNDQAANISFGQAQGPMQIGADGKPVSSGQGAAPEAPAKPSSPADEGFDIF